MPPHGMASARIGPSSMIGCRRGTCSSSSRRGLLLCDAIHCCIGPHCWFLHGHGTRASCPFRQLTSFHHNRLFKCSRNTRLPLWTSPPWIIAAFIAFWILNKGPLMVWLRFLTLIVQGHTGARYCWYVRRFRRGRRRETTPTHDGAVALSGKGSKITHSSLGRCQVRCRSKGTLWWYSREHVTRAAFWIAQTNVCRSLWLLLLVLLLLLSSTSRAGYSQGSISGRCRTTISTSACSTICGLLPSTPKDTGRTRKACACGTCVATVGWSSFRTGGSISLVIIMEPIARCWTGTSTTYIWSIWSCRWTRTRSVMTSLSSSSSHRLCAWHVYIIAASLLRTSRLRLRDWITYMARCHAQRKIQERRWCVLFLVRSQSIKFVS